MPGLVTSSTSPSGIEKMFEECLERVYDLSAPVPDNGAEIGARFAEAGPRYGMEFFPDFDTGRS